MPMVDLVGNNNYRDTGAVFSKACDNYRMRKLSNGQYRSVPVCDNFCMRYSYSVAVFEKSY